MVMMQLMLSPGQQPRPLTPSQWKHSKYYSLDHTRGQKSTELSVIDTSQVRVPCSAAPYSLKRTCRFEEKMTCKYFFSITLLV